MTSIRARLRAAVQLGVATGSPRSAGHGVRRSNLLNRSDDRGRTWRVVGPTSPVTDAAQPDLVRDHHSHRHSPDRQAVRRHRRQAAVADRRRWCRLDSMTDGPAGPMGHPGDRRPKTLRWRGHLLRVPMGERDPAAR
jgi:hypothetical protein